jgi:hypothetical protein
VQECVRRHGGRLAQGAGTIFVVVFENFLFGRKVFGMEVGDDIYSVGVFDCKLWHA